MSDSNKKSLSIGFSPCPNDTYIFCGLVKGHIPLSGWKLQPEQLEDVETLNEWALEGRLDITKLSFHAFGHVLEEYVLLKSGAALGRGCGPLLVSAQENARTDYKEMTVAVPGQYTTAAMLLKLFAPDWKNIVMMRFDEIMDAIESGMVDCGVIIHESRFTYQDRGLILVKDLGNWWEDISGYPIPLGGIAVKRSLGRGLIEKIDKALNASITWAQRNHELCRPYIKKHSQEIADSVINDHIGLYVNAYSEDVGEEGMAAIEFFLEKGRQAKMFPNLDDPLLAVSY